MICAVIAKYRQNPGSFFPAWQAEVFFRDQERYKGNNPFGCKVFLSSSLELRILPPSVVIFPPHVLKRYTVVGQVAVAKVAQFMLVSQVARVRNKALSLTVHAYFLLTCYVASSYLFIIYFFFFRLDIFVLLS